MKVIGLINYDKTSKYFTSVKHIIENLNIYFKSNYKNIHGFTKPEEALYHFLFNFLRPHQSLENKVSVKINYLEKLST